MKITSKILAPVVVVLFFAGIGLSMAFNMWSTVSSKIPARYVSGEFEGAYNPADIRGSYSFGDIATNFDVSVEILAKAFAVPETEDPAGFQAKELETIYGVLPDGGEVGTDAIRLFVARYAGLPYTPEESTRLPSPAIPLLREKLSTADLEALRSISVNVLDLRNASDEILTEEEHEESEEMIVKGKTTFNDLLEWGISQEKVESILDAEMGPRSQSVRDYAVEVGIEFSVLKENFQEILDSM